MGAGAAKSAAVAPPARAAEEGGWAGPGCRRREAVAGAGGARWRWEAAAGRAGAGGLGLRRRSPSPPVPGGGPRRRGGRQLEVEDEGEPLDFNPMVQKIE